MFLCMIDQCRILIEESRGLEYMGIVYTDPYVRMLQLVTDEEERLIKTHGDFQAKGVSRTLFANLCISD